jgi:hypothetical protein
MPGTENVVPFRAHDWVILSDGTPRRTPRDIESLTPAKCRQGWRQRTPRTETPVPPAPPLKDPVPQRKPVQPAPRSVPATFAGRVAALMATGVSYQQAAEMVQDEATA